jgi:hypothetical protein
LNLPNDNEGCESNSLLTTDRHFPDLQGTISQAADDHSFSKDFCLGKVSTNRKKGITVQNRIVHTGPQSLHLLKYSKAFGVMRQEVHHSI